MTVHWNCKTSSSISETSLRVPRTPNDTSEALLSVFENLQMMYLKFLIEVLETSHGITETSDDALEDLKDAFEASDLDMKYMNQRQDKE